jgi:FkbH-like protein
MTDIAVTSAINQYLTLDPSRRQETYPAFRAEIDTAIKEGQSGEVLAPLRQAVSIGSDYSTLLSLYRLVSRARAAQGLDASVKRPKVAIVGSYTTQQLTWLIDLFLFAGNIDAEIYEAEYGVLRQEVYNSASELYRFQPQVVLFLAGYRDVAGFPEMRAALEDVRQMARVELDSWKQLWHTLYECLGCQIIQNTFATPPWGALGHLEGRLPFSMGSYLRRLNQGIFDEAPAHVAVHDMERLSSLHGKWAWSDDRFYFDAKLPCAPEHLPVLAHSLCSQVLAINGKSKKCLVLDLDNTLWGGVIGDDGLGGIVLGQGDPQGEAFVAFQQYARRLKDRGVILAVCSKNDEANAREPFESHPEMVLRLNDITCFVANWDDKATNLRRIAEEINIGIDSLVLVDDNPVERGIVRRFLPEVGVPELPEDPAGYVRVLDLHRYFEMTALSQEDLERSQMYAADAQRKAMMTSTVNLDEYLQSLNMTAVVEPLNDVNFERFAQLINKSNQFNLTTKRYSPADLERVRSDPEWVTRGFRLRDQFGDNGLICVVLGYKDDVALEIDSWLMSCRVLNRGVEELVMSHLHSLAREAGLKYVEGEYRPTSKNGMVKDHYQGLGFEKVSESDKGVTRWRLPVGDDESRWPHYIAEVSA